MIQVAYMQLYPSPIGKPYFLLSCIWYMNYALILWCDVLLRHLCDMTSCAPNVALYFAIFIYELKIVKFLF